jgi:hypothetical protein
MPFPHGHGATRGIEVGDENVAGMIGSVLHASTKKEISRQLLGARENLNSERSINAEAESQGFLSADQLRKARPSVARSIVPQMLSSLGDHCHACGNFFVVRRLCKRCYQ